MRFQVLNRFLRTTDERWKIWRVLVLLGILAGPAGAQVDIRANGALVPDAQTQWYTVSGRGPHLFVTFDFTGFFLVAGS